MIDLIKSEKCLTLSVQTVVNKHKYHSNLTVNDQFTAEIVIESINHKEILTDIKDKNLYSFFF